MNITRRILFLGLLIFSGLITFSHVNAVGNDNFFVDGEVTTPTIKSATEYDYPPFSVINDGQADGFSVELLEATLKAVDLDVEFYVGPWSEIKEDLTEGRIDVLPLVGRTPEREVLYDFTVPYISIYGNIFVRRDHDNINKLSDLWGKEVLVMAGDNAEEFARREKVSDNIIAVESYEEAFTLLAEGKYDAIIIQEIVGKQLIKKLGINNVIAVSQIDNFKQDFTFAVQEGNAELLTRLNDGLSKIIISGQFDEIYNEWIAPILVENKSVDVEFIQSYAKETAEKIDEYLINHPELTIEDLQKDDVFKSIAVQRLGDEGYTGLVDSESGYFYLHPQEKLVNTDSHLLKEQLPDWWKIHGGSIGPKCKNSSGYYEWEESNGTLTDKYMVTACVDTPTADNKKLFVGATSYIDKKTAEEYIEEYNIKNSFEYSKLAIKQKAEDVAKQVEIYLRGNPEMTVKDFQEDPYFQKIAVQLVGKTGYTAVTDYNTLVARYHTNPAIVDLDLHTLKNKLPGFWDVMSKSEGGLVSDGVYAWEEADGTITQKYMYIAIVDAKTADGIGLSVAATTYLDEYEKEFIEPDQDLVQKNNEVLNFNYLRYIYLFISILVVVVFLLVLLYYFKILKLERTSLIIILIFLFSLVGGMFIFGSISTINNLKSQFKDNHRKQYFEIGNLLSEKLLELFEDMEKELEYISENYSNDDCSEECRLSLLKGAYERNKDYVHAFTRIDKDNIIKYIYPNDDSAIGIDIGGQEHVIKLKKTMSPVFSDIFDAVQGFPGIAFQYPVIKNGDFDGIVDSFINANDFFGSLSFFLEHIHNNESFLLETDGNIITSGINDYLGKNILTLEKYKAVKNDLESIFKEEKEGYIEFVINGENQVVNYQPIEAVDKKIFLLTVWEEKEAYHGLDSAMKNIWFFTFIALASFAVTGIFFSYFLTKSLRKEVDKKTSEVRNTAEFIKNQLKKEEIINKEKEKLLIEQKKDKKKLEEKVEEMEKFNDLVVGRELKMREMKKTIKELENIKKTTNKSKKKV
ncbi:MAG: transporter substrate-binding domain-containing protein [Patescibacteria group bacterium]|jgi:ABC-type amino acid transport substrate-binding protein|nr:transporter substrate-binding domain-containing protein [Patescibacteria group bacterium]